MANRENTETGQYAESRQRAADFTALTAATPAASQPSADAFAAAMWAFTLTDNA